MATARESYAKIFFDRVQERRDAGELVAPPWRQTWNPVLGMNRNLVSGAPYRGFNIWMTILGGFDSPLWVTRNQLKSIKGAEVKRQVGGEHDGKLVPYTPILWWWFPDKNKPEDAGRSPFCKWYQVWNVEQVNGVEKAVEKAIGKLTPQGPVNPIESAQALVDGWHGKPVIGHGSAKAFYRPSEDRVSMPDMRAFESAEAYYRVLFHELTHSTGHRTRLERDGVANPARFADHAYSEEELIAEMGAAMLAGFAGIASEEADANSAAYLDHWLKVLKGDPNMLFSAGGAAQKAADMVRGIKWEKAEK